MGQNVASVEEFQKVLGQDLLKVIDEMNINNVKLSSLALYVKGKDYVITIEEKVKD